MRKLQFRKVKFDAGSMTDGLIGIGATEFLPGLLNKWFFSSSPLTGLTLNAFGVGLSYLIASFINKPAVFNIGIANTLLNWAYPLVSGSTAVTTQDYSYLPMSDYNNSASVVPYNDYVDNY